ncbi:TetR/AcrR family transcriptional regulator [Ornithinibacillus contaminans]|uniref:TetR/AcrR family transcriptional regulator n=1 Tax=Ornithinibacillus contaminans TaxID=694055 RepID=UPI00069E600C|nr:TetR/AcrR family transcriptional regulator [Ornithinibacillus contaminans]
MTREWIPIPGTNKHTLIHVALEEFSSKGYKGVNITELAKKANMTTGAIYHHFGSKAKLYEVIRSEMEQRIMDRMEGITSVVDDPSEGMQAALITGLKFAVKMNICRLLCEDAPNEKVDKVADFLASFNEDPNLPVSILLISTWRSVLNAISEEQITLEQGENLIKWIFKKGTN